MPALTAAECRVRTQFQSMGRKRFRFELFVSSALGEAFDTRNARRSPLPPLGSSV
jgi:hypothetical protein